MPKFSANFIIIEARNCPFYSMDDIFTLTDQAVEFAPNHCSCLILLRELTRVLVELIPSASTEFAEYRDRLFTCGGCRGLVKFQLTQKKQQNKLPASINDVENCEDDTSIMHGHIDKILPAELLQFFHMHQKTGRLSFEFGKQQARVAFRDGALLAARYDELELPEAVYAILGQKKGEFRFFDGLPEALMGVREMGDFMMILMEGLKRLDEER